ncbi:MAG: guanylate kinase, partial [Desulfobacterales bacterium]
YYFIKKEDFEKKIKKNQWAEWAEVHGNYYGTPAEFLDKRLAMGFEILLEIDVQGAILILKRYPESITIFIMPPSLKILKQRLEQRGADSKEIIENRLLNAEKELAQKDIYHHIIVNDQLPKAVREIVSVIEKYHDHQRLPNRPSFGDE